MRDLTEFENRFHRYVSLRSKPLDSLTLLQICTVRTQTCNVAVRVRDAASIL